MPRFTDLAICLRDLDWSETSQVVVLLTKQHGKVRGLAKGARRQSPSSIARFSGGINLLNLGQAIITTKPATQLAAITEWDLRSDYHPLRNSLHAQWSAMYAADLTSAMLADEDPHPDAFEAMTELLNALTTSANNPANKQGNIPGSLLRFQWALLSDVGYRPDLDRDVETGQPLPGAKAYSFDPALGGLTVRNGLNDERWRVRRATVDLLRDASAGRPLDQHSPQAITRANRLLCTYARALLDKQLPTMKLILSDSFERLGN